MSNEVQNVVNSVEKAVNVKVAAIESKAVSEVKSEIPIVESKLVVEAKRPITVKIWVLIAAIIVAAVIGHIL